MKKFEAASATLERALAMSHRLHGETANLGTATTLNLLGYILVQDREEFGQARDYLTEALEMYSTIYEGRDHKEIASTLIVLSHAYGGLGEAMKAFKIYNKAWKVRGVEGAPEKCSIQ